MLPAIFLAITVTSPPSLPLSLSLSSSPAAIATSFNFGGKPNHGHPVLSHHIKIWAVISSVLKYSRLERHFSQCLIYTSMSVFESQCSRKLYTNVSIKPIKCTQKFWLTKRTPTNPWVLTIFSADPIFVMHSASLSKFCLIAAPQTFHCKRCGRITGSKMNIFFIPFSGGQQKVPVPLSTGLTAVFMQMCIWWVKYWDRKGDLPGNTICAIRDMLWRTRVQCYDRLHQPWDAELQVPVQ